MFVIRPTRYGDEEIQRHKRNKLTRIGFAQWMLHDSVASRREYVEYRSFWRFNGCSRPLSPIDISKGDFRDLFFNR